MKLLFVIVLSDLLFNFKSTLKETVSLIIQDYLTIAETTLDEEEYQDMKERELEKIIDRQELIIEKS